MAGGGFFRFGELVHHVLDEVGPLAAPGPLRQLVPLVELNLGHHESVGLGELAAQVFDLVNFGARELIVVVAVHVEGGLEDILVGHEGRLRLVKLDVVKCARFELQLLEHFALLRELGLLLLEPLLLRLLNLLLNKHAQRLLHL